MGKTYRYRPDDDGYVSRKSKKVRHSSNRKSSGMKTESEVWDENDDRDWEYGILLEDEQYNN